MAWVCVNFRVMAYRRRWFQLMPLPFLNSAVCTSSKQMATYCHHTIRLPPMNDTGTTNARWGLGSSNRNRETMLQVAACMQNVCEICIQLSLQDYAVNDAACIMHLMVKSAMPCLILTQGRCFDIAELVMKLHNGVERRFSGSKTRMAMSRFFAVNSSLAPMVDVISFPTMSKHGCIIIRW